MKNMAINCSNLGNIDPSSTVWTAPTTQSSSPSAEYGPGSNCRTNPLALPGGFLFPVVSGRLGGKVFVHVNYATPDPSFTREELMERLDGCWPSSVSKRKPNNRYRPGIHPQTKGATAGMTDFTDKATLDAFNNNIVDEFRANAGKVGGPFEVRPFSCSTTTGAKSGQPRLNPLAYLVIDGRCSSSVRRRRAHRSALGSQPAGQPDSAHRAGNRVLRRYRTGTAARRRTRPAVRQDHRRISGVRRLPIPDQPGHSAVRTHSRLSSSRPVHSRTGAGPTM